MANYTALVSFSKRGSSVERCQTMQARPCVLSTCIHCSTSIPSPTPRDAGGMYFGISNDLVDGTFDRAASSFFILVTIAFTPPFTVITVWQDERVLVKREVNQNVYGLGVFFWAKTLVLVPVELFFSVLVRCQHACSC